MLLISMCYQVVTRGTTRIILIQWGGEVVLVPQKKNFPLYLLSNLKISTASVASLQVLFLSKFSKS